jgi:hypothetical protein
VSTPIDLAKMRSIGYLSRGRSGDKVRTYRREVDGQLAKEVTDERGNTVTQHGESQDVNVRPETVRLHAAIQEG